MGLGIRGQGPAKKRSTTPNPQPPAPVLPSSTGGTLHDASKAVKHLKKDLRMRPILERIGPPTFHEYSKEDLLENLLEAIVSQQLSGKVAKVIFERLKALDGNSFPNPKRLLKASDQVLRKVGLSRAKILSVRDLCDAVLTRRLDLKGLGGLTDDEVVEALCSVRGIGPWTAHMALIFTLARPDVWPSADLGLRKALKEVLGLPEVPTPREAEPLGDPWKPYRSYACWYLWQYLDK
jgi:DNA-3-methyladenine glycosylase II